MTVYGMIGILGVGLYLSAYALLQTGYLRGSGYAYTLLNMAGAACVAISLVDAFNLSSLLIQVSWILISIVGLARMALINRSLRFSAEDLGFHDRALPNLPRRDLRRLLNLGEWTNVAEGDVLTTQDVPVDHLIYVTAGHADVFKNAVRIAQIRPDHFVGEITCLHGGPATATVIARSPMRVLRIPAEKLRTHLPRHVETYDQLERSFAADLRRKLSEHGKEHLFACDPIPA